MTYDKLFWENISAEHVEPTKEKNTREKNTEDTRGARKKRMQRLQLEEKLSF